MKAKNTVAKKPTTVHCAVFLAHDLEGQQRSHRDQDGDDDEVQSHLFPEQVADAHLFCLS